MATMDQIDLVWDRFILRDDAYATQWFEENKGSGYRRVTDGRCPNNPPCPKRVCPHIKNRPLTKSQIGQHLDGTITLGIYQLSTDNYVNWLCLDVDIKKGTEGNDLQKRVEQHTLALGRVLNKLLGKGGFLVERSGSKGYHLWVFFDKAQARYAHALGNWVTLQAEPPDGIEVEVFPKQTALRSYGNLVKLPLGVHKKTNNRCLFVNGWFQTHEDQWDALRKVTVFTDAEIAHILSDNKIQAPIHIRQERSGSRVALPCLERIFEEGLSEGNRDAGMFAAANYVRDFGLGERYARSVLHELNSATDPPMLDDELDKKIDSAYNGDYSSFPCNQPVLDSFCCSQCRFWTNKVNDRWVRYGKKADEAVGRISRD